MARTVLTFFGGLALAAVVAAPGFAGEPMILSDKQLDTVTAGIAFNLDLAATASGPVAMTSTTGRAQVGVADVLRVDGNPQTGMRLVSDSPADVAWGGGQAAATGTDAGCTAKITVIGDIAYLTQIGSAVATPTSVICSCAAMAISFIPR